MADDSQENGHDAGGDDGDGDTESAPIDWQQRAVAAEERVADLEAVARHHLGDDVDLDGWMDEALTFRRDGTPVVTAPKSAPKRGESKDDGGATTGDDFSSAAGGGESQSRRRQPRRPEPQSDDKPKGDGRLDRDSMSPLERFENRHKLAAQEDADAARV